MVSRLIEEQGLEVLHTNGIAEGWRLPFGESGILDVATNIIASPGIDDDLAKQSLRIIGNTCIDTGSMTYLPMHSFVNACSFRCE